MNLNNCVWRQWLVGQVSDEVLRGRAKIMILRVYLKTTQMKNEWVEIKVFGF